ncbi:ATPase family AAA domain-containing protein 2-like isoform X2 [Euwallacea fornicatus]|uniref:ATPase family AAA domain-containing protein 2-like isoform X2 n=1 Tax=Euwallacea fornicatus TaxID=995702 RepID=UPI0033902681
MSLHQNTNRASAPPQASVRCRFTRESSLLDFNKIGGLKSHLKVLREIIIFPLLHGNVFTHFNIKAPRGVLFYGLPGTGKSLVAAALANEINREGVGKVAFFHRKGADILDKWVGGSEKNLMDLFEKAIKSKPSIIFFDELDGLAPARDKQVDQIHSSVVATLLALMDGLDNKPGVIVIGATNRLEAIDPALRRSGRFDKELYFPLPGVDARRDILKVHMASWKHKPSPKLISFLAGATSGFSGADLQALCSKAIVRCMKRVYPCLQGMKVDPEKLKVNDCDFREARLEIVPSTQRSSTTPMRNLTPTIKPLLEGQLKRIIKSIQDLWPHFLQENHKYIVGEERYAGRILLLGSNTQGVCNHLVPALLQQLEYLPSFVYDVTNIFKKNTFLNIVQNPCVILLSRVDEWWDIISDCDQLSIVSTLEDIHADQPILVVATCERDVPTTLRSVFYNNSSILLKIENPKREEREAFFEPLFFGRNIVSLVRVLENTRKENRVLKGHKGDENASAVVSHKEKKRRGGSPSLTRKRPRLSSHNGPKPVRSTSCDSLHNGQKEIEHERQYELGPESCESYTCSIAYKKIPYFTTAMSSLLSQKNAKKESGSQSELSLKKLLINGQLSYEDGDTMTIDKNDSQMQRIRSLWKHASLQTSRGMEVSDLELLYDVISACINIHWKSFDILLKNLEGILTDIEFSNSIEDQTLA